MPIAAVTLDAAGTLFTTREPVGVTYARVAATCGIALEPTAAEKDFRRAIRAAPPLAFPTLTPEVRREQERAWWYAVVGGAFGRGARHPAFDRCFDALFAHFGAPSAWVPFPDTLDALRALRARGLRLGVVSNFDGRLHGLLSAFGVTPLVNAVLVSAAQPVAKPDARIFHAAAARLGVAPHEILHAGDDLDADVRGALAAGCHAALLTRDGTGRAPVGVAAISSLRELEAVIERPY